MKRFAFLYAALFCVALRMVAYEKLTIADVTSGKFAARTISNIRPIAGTDQYACISDDQKRIELYSFKTGKLSNVLFDASHTLGESISRVEGYIPSPDGSRLLVQTQT